MNERPEARARLIGGLLLLLSLGAAGFAGKLALGGRSSWTTGLAIQAGLTAVWLLWCGVQLIRQAPWSTFRLVANMALAAGAVGIFVNLPYVFVQAAEGRGVVDITLARAACIAGGSAFVAGLGHRAAANKSPFAAMMHSLALLAPFTIVALYLNSYVRSR